MKKTIIIFFIALLFLPLVLNGISSVSDVKTDVTLGGYQDTVDKPVLKIRDFFDGAYQTDYTRWFEKTFSPRGVFTKTYNTIQYQFFRESNDIIIIGNNRSLFASFYLTSELCIGNQHDFSLLETQQHAKEFVEHLISVQQKLSAYDKSLIVYITPSKAHHFPEDIPYKYRIQASTNAVRGVDYLIPLLKESGIEYIYCDDLAQGLSYPTFYPTGIHWSRPYEQLCHNALISKVSELTGKKYQTIQLGDVKESPTPFWRDADLFDLLSIWQNVDGITYYEYSKSPIKADEYDPINLLVQGGSFVEGLGNEMMSVYPESRIGYINYDEYYSRNNAIVPFGGDWSQVPMHEMLDEADCVVVEMNEAVIKYYTDYFVQYLDDFLDNYKPSKRQIITTDKLIYEDGLPIPGGIANGIWHDGWTTENMTINIQNAQVRESGLEIRLVVPSEIFLKSESSNVCIYVNGKKLYDNQFTEGWDGKIVLPPEELPVHSSGQEDIFTVSILSDAGFVPSEIANSTDTRELHLLLRYIGEVA